MHLETERLIIRDFTFGDLNDLHDIFSDTETMRFIEPPYSKDKTRNFLETFCIHRDPPGAYAAVECLSKKMIGYILLKPLDDPEIYEIGWIFNRSYWGKGYAYESCSVVIKYGFNTLNLHKICAETIDPAKSLNLMEKLGMKLEGIMRQQSKEPNNTWQDIYWAGIIMADIK